MITTIAIVIAAQYSYLDWPVEGIITSQYGPRWGKMHKGIDISTTTGTWVRTAKEGLVVFAGDYGDYGNLVIVRHDDGSKTFYAHLQNFCVFRYQRLKRRQKVGRVGSTGKSTGPHLHFEVRINNEARDPLSLLPIRSLENPLGATAVGGP